MSNELQVLDQNVIVQAFSNKGGVNDLFERVAEQVRKEVPDVSTQKGRNAIGSLAMKVSKTKKLIEDSGKALVAEQKAQIKLIDDDRISVVKMFDQLRDEILSPRDAWEQAEKDRIAKHEQALTHIKEFLYPENLDVDSITLECNIAYVQKLPMGTMYEEFEDKIKLAKFEVLEALNNSLVSRKNFEAEQAEIEKQRIAEQERLQKERDEAIAKQAAENARIEAEQKAKAEADRIEAERQAEIDNANKARIEAEEREDKLKHEAEQAILREQQAKENAEKAAKQAEHDRELAIISERERIEREQKQKDEYEAKMEEQRKANIEHMRQVNNDILQALLETGITEDQAKDVIKAIAKNQVPHVSIKY